MEATKDTRVSFMSVFSDPMCFSALYEHLRRNDKATLRLVCKELRDAVNLNARGLQAELQDDNHEPVDMSHFISKLPNLEIISADVSFSSGGIVNVFQGAKLARRLTKLELRSTGDDEEVLTDEERERRAGVTDNSFGTISHNQWPLLQSLIVCDVNATLTVQSMKGLLHLSTLTKLDLHHYTFNNESFNLIQPDSWPCLRHLDLYECRLEDPTVVIRALLHLTGLEELSLNDGGITGEALAQIQPGRWPHLQLLDLCDNEFGDDPVGAIKGLLHLTALTKLKLYRCRLTGTAISQIKPGNWPYLQKMDIGHNVLGDDPVAAMKGLLHLTALTELDLRVCSLTGEAINQIWPGDWPYLQQLDISVSDFRDDPVAAMKGLLHLTALTELDLKGCRLTGTAVSQIKPGDWPHLQQLDIICNDFSDDLVGAMKGLLHLTALTQLNLHLCSLSGTAISQIKPGDWPCLQKLKMAELNLSDDPVGAMRALLNLTALIKLDLSICRLTGAAISQIWPGDWPHLLKLRINSNDLSDDLVGAKKGLMRLTSLYYLDIENCGWTKEDISDICRALGVEPGWF